MAELLSLDAPIVEGIETAEQLAAPRDVAVQWGQDFLFGRPAPAAEITDLVVQGRIGV